MLDEALAIYLYLKDQCGEHKNDELLRRAWLVICDQATSAMVRALEPKP